MNDDISNSLEDWFDMICPCCHGAGEVTTGEPLTAYQAKVYHAIRDFYNANGFAPSYEEIKGLCGIRSLATVSQHVHNLVAKGWLYKGKANNARSIIPLERAA